MLSEFILSSVEPSAEIEFCNLANSPSILSNNTHRQAITEPAK